MCVFGFTNLFGFVNPFAIRTNRLCGGKKSCSEIQSTSEGEREEREERLFSFIYSEQNFNNEISFFPFISFAFSFYAGFLTRNFASQSDNRVFVTQHTPTEKKEGHFFDPLNIIITFRYIPQHTALKIKKGSFFRPLTLWPS